MFVSSMTRPQRGFALMLGAMAVVAAIVDCGGDSSAPPAVSSGKLSVTVNAAAGALDTPLDAVPDPMGNDIFFIASSKGEKGIFRVSGNGGAVSQVYLGAPLVDPRGITISADGATLFVADPGADPAKGGAVFQLPAIGDTPTPIEGTAGTHPTALDIVGVSKGDVLYYTGTDEAGDPAIFEVPIGEGTVTELFHGAPLVKPNGIVVTTKQAVFIADAAAGKGEAGQVFQLGSGKLSIVGPEFVPGDPTGIAVTLDETKALVSSLDPQKGTSQVVILDLAAHTSSTFSDVIKANTYSGGLHRARFKNSYAWAGKTTVYSVKVKILLGDSSTPGGPGDNN